MFRNQKTNEDEENPPIEPVSSGNNNYQYNNSSNNFDGVSTSNAALAFDPVSSSTNNVVNSIVNNAPQAAFNYEAASLDFILPPDVDITDPILVVERELTPESPLPSGSGKNFDRTKNKSFHDFNADIPIEPSQSNFFNIKKAFFALIFKFLGYRRFLPNILKKSFNEF